MYEFVKASRRPFHGIEVDNKVLMLGKRTNAFTTHDKALADEINAKYGWKKGATGDLIMNTVDTEKSSRRVKFFVMPELPWKRKKVEDG
jgi:hypothetical protein